jgi:hypothetical protein
VTDQKGKFLYNLKYPVTDDQIRGKILLNNCFVHSSILYRRQLALELKGYNEQARVEDYDLWLRMGSKMKFANLNRIATQHTFNSSGVTYSDNKSRIVFALKAIKKYRTNYPHFLRAYAKWMIQYILVLLLGSNFFVRLKSYFIHS